MQTALLLLSCIAFASASPVLFLTYSESAGRLPRASFLECAFPTPYFDKASNQIKYRCPTSALNAPAHKRSSIELLEAIDEEDGIEVIEVLEEPSSAGLNQPIVIVKPLDETRVENQVSYGKNKCEDDEVYNSEIDQCVKYIPGNTKPKDKKPKDKKQTNKVEKEEPEVVVISVGQETKPRCPEGEFYLSELDICICYPAENCKDKDD